MRQRRWPAHPPQSTQNPCARWPSAQPWSLRSENPSGSKIQKYRSCSPGSRASLSAGLDGIQTFNLAGGGSMTETGPSTPAIDEHQFLELEQVNVARGDRVVLHDLNLSIRAGEHVA